ncbi:unnamed protein product [Closterium sp. NIES-54]
MHRDATATGTAEALAPVPSSASPPSALPSKRESGEVSTSHRHFLSLLRECYAGQVFDSSPVDFTSDLGVRFLSQPPPVTAQPQATSQASATSQQPLPSQPPLAPQSTGSAPASAVATALAAATTPATPAPVAPAASAATAAQQPRTVRHTLVRSAAVVLDWLLLPEFEKQRAAQWATLLHCSVRVVPCSLLPAPCSLLPVPCSLLPATCSLLPVPCSLLPAPCSLLPVPCSLLPAPCSLFPVPCSLLPAPCSLLPAPCSLLPAPFHSTLPISTALRYAEPASLPTKLLGISFDFRGSTLKFFSFIRTTSSAFPHPHVHFQLHSPSPFQSLAPVLLLCSTDDQLAPIGFIRQYEREAGARGAAWLFHICFTCIPPFACLLTPFQPMAPVLLLCSTDDQLAPIGFIWKYEREAVTRGAAVTRVEWSTSEHVGHLRHHRYEYITALQGFLMHVFSLWEQQHEQPCEKRTEQEQQGSSMESTAERRSTSVHTTDCACASSGGKAPHSRSGCAGRPKGLRSKL